MKDLVGTGVCAVVLNDGITQHMVIFKNLCPESKHFILHSADVFLIIAEKERLVTSALREILSRVHTNGKKYDILV